MGLTDFGKATALAAALPGGTNRYIALLTELPNEDGTGGVEVSGNSYARKANSAWTLSTANGITYRQNSGTITFNALSGPVNDVVGWAIYDAASNGNIVAFGYLRDSGGTITSFDFIAGDQPQFHALTLQVGID